MRFRDFLKMEAIKFQIGQSNKRSVIEKLVDDLKTVYKLPDKDPILKSVLERESLMSTGVGKGVAIPHGKVDAINEVLGSMLIINPGVEFGSPDEIPVQIAILLVASSKETGPHIRALAHISRVLQDEKVREEIVHSKTAKEILDILDRKEKEL
jgi:mannitol/fructose-specific phosphotransferase system IIA component (Ntr-type)